MSSKSKSNNRGFYISSILLSLVIGIAGVHHHKVVSDLNFCESRPEKPSEDKPENIDDSDDDTIPMLVPIFPQRYIIVPLPYTINQTGGK